MASRGQSRVVELVMSLVMGLAIAPFATAGEEEANQTNQTTAATPAASALESNADDEFHPLGVMIPTEKSIAFFKERADARPRDYRNRTILGQLYLRHAKETDDLASYDKAEQVLRTAIANGPDYLPAKTYLATALQARHQFAEALELANEVYRLAPQDTLALATIGDCQLNLGQYDAAERTYHELASQVPQEPTVMVRLAHLWELNGDHEKAISTVASARDLAYRDGEDVDQLAWYEMRLAELYFSQGRLAEAASSFRLSLAKSPSYAPAMAGLAKVLAAQGDTSASIALYQSAIEAHDEPPMMAGLGDVYQLVGKTELANQWYDKADARMAEEAKTAAAAHYREVANFYLDHDRKPAEALHLARKDLELRDDIHGADTLAWALHKNGQHEEAKQSIARAIRLGTRDAKLYYHAAKISEALEEYEDAARYIRKALDINPNFSLLAGADARALLERLDGIVTSKR